jgi:hydrogenase-1 operon protein HyaF
MAQAVLAEVAQHLEALASSGTTSTIDLRSLPLTDADLAELEALLGKGEVRASIDVIGTTEVHETAFAGVWWLRHMGAQDRVAAEEIAITPVPDILHAQADDIREAAQRIRSQIETAAPAGAEQEAVDG